MRRQAIAVVVYTVRINYLMSNVHKVCSCRSLVTVALGMMLHIIFIYALTDQCPSIVLRCALLQQGLLKQKLNTADQTRETEKKKKKGH